MGLLRRLIGAVGQPSTETESPGAPPQKPASQSVRRRASKSNPRHLTLQSHSWDKPDEPGGDDLWGSGYRIVDEDGVVWQWREEGMGAGLVVTTAAGVQYKLNELQDAAFAPGRRLALVLEPENPHDPNAVGVWDQEKRQQIGYVPKSVCEKIAGRLRSGKELEAFVLWEWINKSERDRRERIKMLIAPTDIVHLDWQ